MHDISYAYILYILILSQNTYWNPSIHDCSPSSEDVDVLQISIDIGELRSEAEELRAQVLTLQADRDALVIQKKKMEVTGLLNSWIPVFSDCAN